MIKYVTYEHLEKYMLSIPNESYLNVNSAGRMSLTNIIETYDIADDCIIKVIKKIGFENIMKISVVHDILKCIIAKSSDMLKTLIEEEIITKDMLTTKYINYALKRNKSVDLLIQYGIINKDTIDETTLVNIITYCPEIFDEIIKYIDDKHLLTNCIADKVIIDNDEKMVVNYIKMNIILYSAIHNHVILNKLLNMKNMIVSIKFYEEIDINDKTYTILTLAMLNNPDSVQTILASDLCTDKFIARSFDLLDFEKIIEIQPASWYYLVKNSKSEKYTKINNQVIHYNSNWKLQVTKENISKVAHFILGKQVISKRKCEICDIFEPQVVLLSECKHKFCISCALRMDLKCHKCGSEFQDKILFT